MLVTFSPTGNPEMVIAVVDAVSAASYAGNLYAAITWTKGRRVRFTIETRDAWAHGSRRSANGRHMRKASWQAHYDVMEALLRMDRTATIRTALASYKGLADFLCNAPKTSFHNVGSHVKPVAIGDLSV